ncbi:hypothetical protein CHLNCDRAFT_35844 [Chlorella variabilis]|uniref:FYVE-type domain-containing protein n=1 Tax=Chlorella variabilis TaxID=554065 RepID=E1ZH60_CHLVA|nr:hypothetical protein CHLNCDRAFT_35844 [Chlorella variabilis]EFN54864.1 hypothetical protein CHLNCDRAFT_35844 [Chlorella variabilis]|eukprot:XP_005846966.1 hypothetical protein CHLNCDRAFT_35844 [Chlorella variabilis]
MARNSSLPSCALCTETLGTYGGPTTLPCGHNLCVHCTAYLQQRQAQCPLCRAEFPQDMPLAVNCELRELMRMAQALTATPVEDDWQAVHSTARVDVGACKHSSSGGGGGCAPAHVGVLDVMDGSGSVMELDPQPWEPDSSSATCRGPGCNKPFSFLLRPRHHCRSCGQLFCGACAADRLLLPPKFQLAEPQRVCAACRALLLPIQPLLAGSIAPAVRQPVHDVYDYSALRSLLNPPLTSRLDTDIYTATNIVRAFRKVGSLPSEASIPPAILRGCAGLAILSVARAGAGWSFSVGSGLVVARAPGGGWSPPSAVLSLASAVGWQVGVEVRDLVLVLRTRSALSAFCAAQLGVGGSVSLAAGPLGRAASATALANLAGGALVYSYSSTRGAFAGVALEGSLLATRDSLNQQFYGRKVTARQLLLSGGVPPPPAAAALYATLDELLEQAGGAAPPPQFLSAAAGEERGEEPPPATAASAPPLLMAHAAAVESEEEEEWEAEELPSAPQHQWGRQGGLGESPRGRSLYPALVACDDPHPYGSLFD